jgi:hypothetical protein
LNDGLAVMRQHHLDADELDRPAGLVAYDGGSFVL